MKSSLLTKCLLAGVFTAGLWSCRDFSSGALDGDRVVASVGDTRLYAGELEEILSPAADSLDSVRLAATYVDTWIKRQLKLKASEEEIREKEELERKVEEYRNSLLILELEKQYVENRLDTVISREEIEAYYERYRNDFRVNHPLVKALAIVFPVGFRQESKVWELTITQKPEWEEELIDLFVKNGLEYHPYTEWTDLREVTRHMPNVTEEAYKKLQAAGNFLQTEEGDQRYIVIVRDILPEGAVMPLDMAEPSVRIRIVHQRRQELLRAMEEELYRAASENGEITINIQQ